MHDTSAGVFPICHRVDSTTSKASGITLCASKKKQKKRINNFNFLKKKHKKKKKNKKISIQNAQELSKRHDSANPLFLCFVCVFSLSFFCFVRSKIIANKTKPIKKEKNKKKTIFFNVSRDVVGVVLRRKDTQFKKLWVCGVSCVRSYRNNAFDGGRHSQRVFGEEFVVKLVVVF